MPTIVLLRGSTDANNPLIGLEGEVTFDSTKGELRLHDGEKAGGHETATASITTLGQLTDASNIWTESNLTMVSQLGNNGEFWSTGSLTKVSQLQNDPGYKNGFCQYCWHCTYCQNCGRCNNVQCSQVQCNQKNCQNCSDCTACRQDRAWIGGTFVFGGISICTKKCVYKDC